MGLYCGHGVGGIQGCGLGEEEQTGKKRAKKKGIEAQGAKPRTQTPAVDALIGDEEQTGKKREQRCSHRGLEEEER